MANARDDKPTGDNTNDGVDNIRIRIRSLYQTRDRQFDDYDGKPVRVNLFIF